MTQDELKKAVAKEAFDYVESLIESDTIIGVGTGSTANFFIQELGKIGSRLEGTVASSEETARRLKSIGIPVFDLNSVGEVHVYVDGADETDEHLHLIKGGGAALTREKIIAAASQEFVCIADESKFVSLLGNFPLPVEVIPMSRSLVARNLVELGGRPIWREAFETDNGNWILDVHDLRIEDPSELESTINDIPGVVANGIFAQQKADVVILGSNDGVRRF